MTVIRDVFNSIKERIGGKLNVNDQMDIDRQRQRQRDGDREMGMAMGE